jgi:hypothetical protein
VNAVHAAITRRHDRKAEFGHCGCSLTIYRRTLVLVLESSRKAECMASTGVRGFDGAFDHAPLQAQWRSNDTLHASYPDYPNFPQTQYSAGDPARPRVRLVFDSEPSTTPRR